MFFAYILDVNFAIERANPPPRVTCSVCVPVVKFFRLSHFTHGKHLLPGQVGLSHGGYKQEVI